MLEYEEVYNEKQLKNRNRMAYYTGNVNQAMENTPNYGLDNTTTSYDNELSTSIPKKSYQQKIMPPRPRSADFLEYESKRQFRRFKAFDQSGNERLPSRPKSSLDINSSMDNYYYSEASYAAKMRQSALYLQNRNLMPNGRDETRLNTLRYENERKRLTNEFNSYMMTNGSLTLPRKFNSNNEAWQFSSLLRNAESNLLKGSGKSIFI